MFRNLQNPVHVCALAGIACAALLMPAAAHASTASDTRHHSVGHFGYGSVAIALGVAVLVLYLCADSIDAIRQRRVVLGG